jgi:hypothetical protein
MFEIFLRLPDLLQTEAQCWGFSDTVFRDECFEFLLEKCFNLTSVKYYSSQIARDYFERGICQNIDLDKIGKK